MATAADMKEIRRDQDRFLLGSFLLGIVVIMWVSSSFITNSLFTSLDYNKPFLMTYIQTSTFSLYLLWPLYEYFVSKSINPGYHDADLVDPTLLALGSHPATGAMDPIDPHLTVEGMEEYFERHPGIQEPSTPTANTATAAPEDKLTTYETFKVALLFCPVWFLANWLSNAALAYTTVSTGTMLSSMSGLFTFVLGSILGVEKMTYIRLLSVLLSLSGVVLVSSDSFEEENNTLSAAFGFTKDSNQPKPVNPLLGDALSLGSAFCYAMYVLLLKILLKDESRVSMTRFFGFVGLINLLMAWPFVLILHFAGIETLQMPPSHRVEWGILINALITFSSDFIYLKAMLMTSPLTVTLGITLTIPLSVVGDIVRGTWYSGVPFILGAVFVFCGFGVHGYADWKEIVYIDETQDDASTTSSHADANRGVNRLGLGVNTNNSDPRRPHERSRLLSDHS